MLLLVTLHSVALPQRLKDICLNGLCSQSYFLMNKVPTNISLQQLKLPLPLSLDINVASQVVQPTNSANL